MFKLTITPWSYQGSPEIEFRIEVEHDGEKHTFSHIIQEDIFKSMWRRIMERACVEFERHYLKEH